MSTFFSHNLHNFDTAIRHLVVKQYLFSAFWKTYLFTITRVLSQDSCSAFQEPVNHGEHLLCTWRCRYGVS